MWKEEGDKSKEGVRNNKRNQTKVRWKRSAASGEGIVVRKWLDLVHLRQYNYVYGGMHVCMN